MSRKTTKIIDALKPRFPDTTIKELCSSVCKNVSVTSMKDKLSPEDYKVLALKGTEMAFHNEFFDSHEEGLYRCKGCGQPLFTNSEKFDSRCGWPSYFAPIGKGLIEYSSDMDVGYERVEAHCSNCGGHLGHVFDDAPTQTGLRYCINSASITLDKSFK